MTAGRYGFEYNWWWLLLLTGLSCGSDVACVVFAVHWPVWRPLYFHSHGPSPCLAQVHTCDYITMSPPISLFLFVSFFWCGPFFLKSLLNFLQYCFCFMFWFLGGEACGILGSQPRIKPTLPALEGEGRWSPTHWPTREVPSPNIY